MLRAGTLIDLDRLEENIKGIKTKVSFFDTPIIEISASKIREHIRQEKPFRHFLQHSVFKIIVERGLYLRVRD
jgi:nicotinic acid mononucleotide adenylyltransferase